MTNSEYDTVEPTQPSKGQLALNGARLALAQLAVDAETLLNAWEEREGFFRAPCAPSQLQTRQQVADAIARCRQELQGLLRLWEPK